MRLSHSCWVNATETIFSQDLFWCAFAWFFKITMSVFTPNSKVFPKSSLHYATGRKRPGRGREQRRVSEVRHMLRDAFPRLPWTDPAPNPSSRRCWAPMSLSLQLWRAAAWRRPGQRRLTGPWQGDCQPWGEWERIYINCFGDHQTFPLLHLPSLFHSLSLPCGMMLYYLRLLLRRDFTCCKSMQPERRTQAWRRIWRNTIE